MLEIKASYRNGRYLSRQTHSRQDIRWSRSLHLAGKSRKKREFHTILLSMRNSSLFFLGLTVALQSARVFAASAPKISNTVYLIRHGEKPSDGGQGLSAQGEERAQCLTNVCGSPIFNVSLLSSSSCYSLFIALDFSLRASSL